MIMLPKKQKYSKVWYLVAILLAMNLAVWSAVYAQGTGEYARLIVFDVGQGDAIYLRSAEGNDLLIDGGPGDAVLSKLGEVMPFGDRKIELVILTHPHADHVSGLVEVAKRYRVDAVMLPDVDYESATYQKFLDLVKEKQIPVLRPALGERLALDAATVLDILYPVVGRFAKAPQDINDASIVARLSFGKSQALLTGDAGKTIEQFLLQSHLPIDAEILKVGHHGSHHSSEAQFLRAVSPDYGVISVGKNSYGHPHPEVLDALQTENVNILRTDQRGDVEFHIYPDHVELLQ